MQYPDSRTATAMDTAAVILLAPGDTVGPDSSGGEIILVMEGAVEIRTGGELNLAGPGTVATVPPSLPRAMRNAGATTARIIRFLPGPRTSRPAHETPPLDDEITWEDAEWQ